MTPSAPDIRETIEMGIFLNRKKERPKRDWSFLFAPLMLLLIISMIVGMAVWVWNTIENSKAKVVNEAFIDSFTLTVPGSAQHECEDFYYVATLEVEASGLGYEELVDEVRNHGIVVFDSSDHMRTDGGLHWGSVDITVRRIDEALTPDIVRSMLSQIPGVADVEVRVVPMAPELDEIKAVSMALDDAKERGTEYLNSFFGLEGAVVVGIDDMDISYDEGTGRTSVALTMTVRAEAK